MIYKIENIRNFLLNREWEEIEGGRNFFNFRPPKELNFTEGFYLSIPKNTAAPDFNSFIDKIANILADIYDLNINDILWLFSKDNTIFSIKVEDAETIQGIISFPRFKAIIEHLKKILTDIVSFVIYDEPVCDQGPPEEAEKYINLCNFLRTEEGSFVVKIQLPSEEILKHKDLFDERDLLSEDINEKLFRILSFIIQKGFYFDGDNLDSYLNKELINLELLKDVYDLYEKSPLTNTTTSFAFLNSRYKKEIKYNDLEEENRVSNIGNLAKFIKVVEDKLFELVDVDTKGTVIELKSKDPESDRNIVVVSAIVNNIKSEIRTTLNTSDYRIAIRAHESKQNVRIKGRAKKRKTRLNITDLEQFFLIET